MMTIKSRWRYQYNRSCAWEKYIGKGEADTMSQVCWISHRCLYNLSLGRLFPLQYPPAFPNHLQCTNPHIFSPCLCKCSPSKTETPRKQTFLSLLFTTNHERLEFFQTQSKILSEFSEWMNEWPYRDPSYFKQRFYSSCTSPLYAQPGRQGNGGLRLLPPPSPALSPFLPSAQDFSHLTPHRFLSCCPP